MPATPADFKPEAVEKAPTRREAVAALLDDPKRCERLAVAARERLCRDHTWERRLPQMLAAAGVHWSGVTVTASQPKSAVDGDESPLLLG